jgi:hypothetical protein
LRRQLASNARREYAPISWPVMRERYLMMMNAMDNGRVATPRAAAPQTNLLAP